jgi:hypothetical protein
MIDFLGGGLAPKSYELALAVPIEILPIVSVIDKPEPIRIQMRRLFTGGFEFSLLRAYPKTYGLISAMGDTESISYQFVEESMFPTETRIAMMEEGPCSPSLKYVGRFAYLRRSKAATLCGLEKKPITPKRIIH